MFGIDHAVQDSDNDDGLGLLTGQLERMEVVAEDALVSRRSTGVRRAARRLIVVWSGIGRSIPMSSSSDPSTPPSGAAAGGTPTGP